ncbi:hypothetical protein GUITHDRAFT_113098 [Guillardia theta CCMP2712]|uniref:Uncharacterized protein n=1 Tax=Guillardia theta (strain CCMP2712) TaxID=905079 RepID=L1IX51_GUITC|nr:hypothetical protein GUITHDRAFT_113098 [Guillardia theta CCMP2712]EKX40833.1 hypothetical protein GUITHDRAFT_113098 [Guillardia theta CCMP2712]|eukprot:XP_005827813.1 hypothetical protein GUITHDRAFT_113098 [Guillardia theta CCMP2712]
MENNENSPSTILTPKLRSRRPLSVINSNLVRSPVVDKPSKTPSKVVLTSEEKQVSSYDQQPEQERHEQVQEQAPLPRSSSSSPYKVASLLLPAFVALLLQAAVHNGGQETASRDSFRVKIASWRKEAALEWRASTQSRSLDASEEAGWGPCAFKSLHEWRANAAEEWRQSAEARELHRKEEGTRFPVPGDVAEWRRRTSSEWRGFVDAAADRTRGADLSVAFLQLKNADPLRVSWSPVKRYDVPSWA